MPMVAWDQIARAILVLTLGVTSVPAALVDAAPPGLNMVPAVVAHHRCFSESFFGSGIVVPRALAIVALDEPGFRIAILAAKAGDLVSAGDVLAVAARPPPSGTTSDVEVPVALVPLKAPVSGVLVDFAMSRGQTVAAGAALASIAADGDREVLLDAPATRVLDLAQGQMAWISTPDGRRLAAHLRTPPIAVDQHSRMGAARLSLESEPFLPFGLAVEVEVETRRSCGVAVPAAALKEDPDGVRLQVVAGSVVQTRLVRIGLRSAGDVEVADGLVNGEIVIARAGTSLRNGDRVTPDVLPARVALP